MQKQTGCSKHGHACHTGLFSRNLFVGQRIPLAGVAHQNGTLRFGHDSRTSVLDRNCRAHDLDNLYVVDVGNTNASLAFYRDTLGLSVAGESENFDVEQEHLNNVFGARVRITAVRAADGPGIELLEYLAPRDGRPAPLDLRANDLAHWQTSLVTPTLEPLLPLARSHRVALVSPGAVDVRVAALGLRWGALTRDPDGHGIRFMAPSVKPLASH